MAFFNSDLTVEEFLQDYWQQRPLVIRQAYQQLPAFDWEAMQQLATRDITESRLIEGAGHDWQLTHGPFETGDFETLAANDWTLLVQDVDKFHTGLASLLADFDFVPNWRLDDIMVSYAAPGGSVGPHTDAYDVFLIQAAGHRRWQISSAPIAHPVWIADCDLRILESFQADETFVLEPGDMLYLPPHYAHHGVAEDSCMTYSVGFRAPSGQELLEAVLVKLLETEQGEQRYLDPSWLSVESSAEISPVAVDGFKSLLNSTLKSAEPLFREVIGELVTAVKPSLEEAIENTLPDNDIDLVALEEYFGQGGVLERNRLVRLAWSLEAGQQLQVFYAGQSTTLPPSDQAVVQWMCEKNQLLPSDWLTIKESYIRSTLLVTLINEGAWQLA